MEEPRIIVHHDEHGLWAESIGSGFRLEKTVEGNFLLASAPLLAATAQPDWAAGESEWGPVAWNLVDPSDVLHCRAVEKRLLEAAGIVSGPPCEHCYAPCSRNVRGDAVCTNPICFFYDPTTTPAAAPKAEASRSSGRDVDDLDALCFDAARFIIERGRASTAELQSQFALGHPRASRLMQQLEALHVVGPYDVAGPAEQRRAILVDLRGLHDIEARSRKTGN
jgi:DNA segregation ATPase FtsK/SpoIIIE-like protein